MSKEPPYYDQNGVEIEEGDLLKVFHFRHQNRKRKMYMYHVAILQESDKGYFWWAGKDYLRKENKGHYWLLAVANKENRIIRGYEIISKPNWENENKLRKEGRNRIKSHNLNTQQQ